MKKFKVGIIGLGGIAKERHIPNWKTLKNAEVVAVSDILKPRMEIFAKDFGIPNTFTDYREMLKMKEIDIIDVCAPNSVHYPAAVSALRSGKHVLCEKPLAVTPSQTEEMIDVSKKYGKKLMAAQHVRFFSKSQAMKKLIEKGEIGEIYYSQARALRRRRVPTPVTFISKKISGGGPCLDIGVHILDLAYWFMGCPKPRSVSGIMMTKLAKREDIRGEWGEWDRKKYDVEDFAAGFIKFENGSVINLECSFLLNMKECEIWSANFFGTEAGVWIDVNGDEAELYKEEKKGFSTRAFKPKKNDPYLEEIKAFVEAIEKNKKVPVPPEQSLDVIRILDAIYRSGRTGREIRL